MSSLNQQYEVFLNENPWAVGMSYEQWLNDILTPKLRNAFDQIIKIKEEEE